MTVGHQHVTELLELFYAKADGCQCKFEFQFRQWGEVVVGWHCTRQVRCSLERTQDTDPTSTIVNIQTFASKADSERLRL